MQNLDIPNRTTGNSAIAKQGYILMQLNSINNQINNLRRLINRKKNGKNGKDGKNGINGVDGINFLDNQFPNFSNEEFYNNKFSNNEIDEFNSFDSIFNVNSNIENVITINLPKNETNIDSGELLLIHYNKHIQILGNIVYKGDQLTKNSKFNISNITKYLPRLNIYGTILFKSQNDPNYNNIAGIELLKNGELNFVCIDTINDTDIINVNLNYIHY